MSQVSMSEIGMSKESVREIGMLFAKASDEFKKGDYTEALQSAATIIEKYPGSFRGWALRGAIFVIIKNYYSAILNCDKALALEPELFHVLNNRGACYVALDLLDEATVDLNKAIELNPNAWEPHLQLGLMYGSLDNYTAAEYHLGEAARLGTKQNLVTHAAYGTLLLGLGKWEGGFKEDLYRPDIMLQPFEAQHWKGEDLSGRHLFLFSEGGQGDRILSLRYINSILNEYSNVRITVRVPKGFVRMVKSSFPEIEVTSANVDCDYVCSLANVPMVLGMAWNTVPRPQRYLSVDISHIDQWKPRFKELPRGLNVGLCWASLNGPTKIIPDKVLEELCSTPQFNFISLQVPHHETTAKIKLLNWSDGVTDWADTAGLIENLDVVISVDTAVAHMAGALGKPVHTIIKYSTYWPWMDHRVPPSPRYSIWYPSMHLFRQQIPGDWSVPMSRIILLIQRQLLGLT